MGWGLASILYTIGRAGPAQQGGRGQGQGEGGGAQGLWLVAVRGPGPFPWLSGGLGSWTLLAYDPSWCKQDPLVWGSDGKVTRAQLSSVLDPQSPPRHAEGHGDRERRAEASSKGLLHHLGHSGQWVATAASLSVPVWFTFCGTCL